MITISNETARDFLVNYQGLNGPHSPEGHEGAAAYMRRVRCIQFDPLNVVGRNPDLVLQARIGNYRPGILEELLYRDRILVDAMDKEMSIIPLEDFPKMARVRKAMTEELTGILSYRGSLETLDILGEVRAYIRDNGPQPAGRIDIGGRAEKGNWGHRKVSSAALDYLCHSGQLGISRRIGTQKVYDLAGNLYPEEILNAEDPFPTEREFFRWYIKRRVGGIGLVWNRKTGAWLGRKIFNQEPRTEIIRELAEEGELTACRVEGSKETFYLRKEDEGFLGKRADRNEARFIAPLDNLIWDRDMIRELFGFTYSWEVYTPAVKRKYGYYVLPVLYKNRFVARFEPERNTGKEPLRIKNWWWEPDTVVTDDLLEAVWEALRRFSAYLGVGMMRDSVLKRKLTGKKGK